MQDEHQNLVRVSIFGNEYTVRAKADPNYIADVAHHVDQKMREVEGSLPSAQLPLEIAILAAMSITDDLFTERRSRGEIVTDVETRAASLIDLIDDVLTPA